MDVESRGQPEIDMEHFHFGCHNVPAGFTKRYIPALGQSGTNGYGSAVLIIDLLTLGRTASKLHEQLGNGAEEILHAGGKPCSECVDAFFILCIMLCQTQAGRPVCHDKIGDTVHTTGTFAGAACNMGCCVSYNTFKAFCTFLIVAHAHPDQIPVREGGGFLSGCLGGSMGFRPAQSGEGLCTKLQNGKIFGFFCFPGIRLPVDKIRLPADVGQLSDGNRLACADNGAGSGAAAGIADTEDIASLFQKIPGSFLVILWTLRKSLQVKENQ